MQFSSISVGVVCSVLRYIIYLHVHVYMYVCGLLSDRTEISTVSGLFYLWYNFLRSSAEQKEVI